jgi:superoxide dismutase
MGVNKMHELPKLPYSYDALEPFIDKIKRGYQLLERKISETPYYLIDGNHRAVAAELCHKNISALEIENDDDLNEIRRRAQEFKLPGFNCDEKTLISLVNAWENYVLNHIEDLRTVRERVEELISGRKLPQEIIEIYHKK